MSTIAAIEKHCLETWGLSAAEVSDIRLAAFFKDALRHIAKNGRPERLSGGFRVKALSNSPGYVPPRSAARLGEFGILIKGKGVDLGKLEWCLEHPCVKDCVDPDPG